MYVTIATMKRPYGQKAVCHPERKHKARGMCWSCYDKWIYHKDPASQMLKHKRWSEENKDHLSGYRKAWGSRNPVKKVLAQVKSGAKTRGIPFALTEADLVAVWTETCPVFGFPIHANERRSDNSLSVDRIDNSAGYVPGNICVMSWRANKVKSDASAEELEKVAQYMRQIESLKR